MDVSDGRRSEKPEDTLVHMLKMTVRAAYTLFVLAATMVIIMGKMLFDFLYEVSGLAARHEKRKRVECTVSEARSR